VFAVVVVVEVLGSLGRIGRAAETFVDGAVDERADGGRRRGRRRRRRRDAEPALPGRDVALGARTARRRHPHGCGKKKTCHPPFNFLMRSFRAMISSEIDPTLRASRMLNR